MKILVVDDDKEIVQLLEIYIRNEGYEPISAYDGKEVTFDLRTGHMREQNKIKWANIF